MILVIPGSIAVLTSFMSYAKRASQQYHVFQGISDHEYTYRSFPYAFARDGYPYIHHDVFMPATGSSLCTVLYPASDLDGTG
jgi:hypothetical protein